MSTPTNPSQNENTYVIDAENAAEMARLMGQDRLTTRSMGGLFPERSDLNEIHDILDIACGPGGWALDVAKTYPHTQVTGIDVSRLMIEYAYLEAREQGLHNASFRVMNALEPLDFPDESFDIVNARFISGFMPKTAWPKLLQECQRILRPGGIIRLTEFEVPITTSLAYQELNEMITRALQLTGQSFSPGGRHFGIMTVLGRLLHNASFEYLGKRAHVNDFSMGAEAYTSSYQDHMAGLKLIQPFLVKIGVATQEEVETQYHRAMAEMQDEDFCGIGFFLTAWGEKPHTV